MQSNKSNPRKQTNHLNLGKMAKARALVGMTFSEMSTVEKIKVLLNVYNYSFFFDLKF